MTRWRFALVVTVIASIAAALPAAGATPAGVKGGGFYRDPDKAKTTLTVSATDDGTILTDEGEAQFIRQTPGTRANAVHISLQCVHVAGSTAVAAGLGADGRMYLIVVKDNGQGGSIPDAFAVVELAIAPAYCLGGIVPTDVRLGFIEGGNFQVSSGA